MTFTSCAPGPNVQEGVIQGGEIVGSWLGLWHGVIAPITFVVSLFSDSVNVYELHNNGNWYNFGFVLGAGVLLGAVSRLPRKEGLSSLGSRLLTECADGAHAVPPRWSTRAQPPPASATSMDL